MSINSEYARNVAAILQESGRARAEAQRQSGQIWGSAISQIGQQLGQAFPQILEMRKQEAIANIFKQNPSDLESAIPKVMAIDPVKGMEFAKRYQDSRTSALNYQEAQLKHQQTQMDFYASILSPVLDEKDPQAAQANYTQGLVTAKGAGLDISKFSPDLTQARGQLEMLRQGTHAGREQIAANLKALADQRAELNAAAERLNKEADNRRADAAQQEAARHNAEVERIQGLSVGRQEMLAAETARHNRAMEANTAAGQTETARHHKALEEKESTKEPSQAAILSAGYARRVEDAEQTLSKLEPDIANMGYLKFTAQKLMPAAGQSALFQQYDQAGRNFVNAVMRRESGAAISESEFENARRQYLPQPGDDAATLKLKQQNRARQFELLKQAGGSAYGAGSATAQGGVPAVGGTFQGGRVLKVTPIP